MNHWIENYALAFLVSAVLTCMIIPRIIQLAFRRRLFDKHDNRKVHQGIVPRLGGLAFLPSIAFAMCLATGGAFLFGETSFEVAMTHGISQLVFGFCAVLLMFMTGIADDISGVKYGIKFFIQILSAILIIASGLTVANLFGLFFIYDVSPIIGYLISGFIIVYVVNAINLIDGIDGLASGLTAIAMIFFSFLFVASGHYLYATLAAASLGTLVPFFIYNVFGSPQKRNKIFMGDTGSLTIGTILAFLCLTILDIDASDFPKNMNPAILAFSPLMLPCFDVVRVFIHRIRTGRNPFMPDKCHIHHKLLALGMRQWQALVTILACDALLIGINLILSPYVQPTWLIIGDVAVWSLANIRLTQLIRKREIRLQKTLYQ